MAAFNKPNDVRMTTGPVTMTKQIRKGFRIYHRGDDHNRNNDYRHADDYQRYDDYSRDDDYRCNNRYDEGHGRRYDNWPLINNRGRQAESRNYDHRPQDF